MKGFSDRALILTPTIEYTKYWGNGTILEFVRVVQALSKFLKNRYNMQACIFNCLSNGFQFPNFGESVAYIGCVCPQDLTFFNQAGIGIAAPTYTYPNSYARAIKACSLKRGQSTEERDADASKRIELTCKDIIEKEISVIFDMEFNKPFLRYKSRPDDGKIVYTVESNYYVSKAQMSGQAFSPGVLLDYDKFTNCLEGWS